MAGGSTSEPQLTGLSKYFNTQTIQGRVNCARFCLAFYGTLGLYFYLKPKKVVEKPKVVKTDDTTFDW